MRVVVLGAGGQVGRELVERVPWPADTEVVGLGRAELDVRDAAGVGRMLDGRPDLVVNCAAYTAVDRAESEPDLAWAVNAEAVAGLARAAADRAVGLVHLSTDYVFDGTSARAYTEEDPVAPLGVYGASKEAGERAIRDAGGRHWIVRTSWVVGVYGANFVKTIARLAAERDGLRVVGDQRGKPTCARDLAAALALASARLVDGAVPAGTYHLAGSPACTWHDLAERVVDRQAAYTGRRPPVAAITTAEWPSPAKRPARSVLDCTRWTTVTGIPAPDWRPGVDAIVSELLGGRA